MRILSMDTLLRRFFLRRKLNESINWRWMQGSVWITSSGVVYYPQANYLVIEINETIPVKLSYGFLKNSKRLEISISFLRC